jgi:hypothetical protein
MITPSGGDEYQKLALQKKKDISYFMNILHK